MKTPLILFQMPMRKVFFFDPGCHIINGLSKDLRKSIGLQTHEVVFHPSPHSAFAQNQTSNQGENFLLPYDIT